MDHFITDNAILILYRRTYTFSIYYAKQPCAIGYYISNTRSDIGDIGVLGPAIACVGVGFYAISAIVCLCKKLFKEFLILHLVMPLTGILVYITEDIEYFIEDTELLVFIPIVFVIAFITCLFRKEYKRAAISLLCCTLSMPLMTLMFQIIELLLDYLTEIYEWLNLYM